MTKKCVKCSKKYDDSYGVCLLCGSKLECCKGTPKKTEEDLNFSRLEFLAMTVIIAIIIIGIFYLIYLAGATYWSNLQDSMYKRGTFPHVKIEKP